MKPLTVVALGGNALAPARGANGLAEERAAVRSVAAELAQLPGDRRLLIVHGNGTQVGRLLAAPTLGDPRFLDVHVAQTQGELGYLIVGALDTALGGGSTVALVTRAVVDPSDPAFATPTKPVGPVLAEMPIDAPAVALSDGGWRRVVPSPRPQAISEEATIRSLLAEGNVVAGGGGGIPIGPDGQGLIAVIDKDWTAALLAARLGAQALIFVTDVPHASRGFGTVGASRIDRIGSRSAEELLRQGMFAAGSMAPKIESAADFARATGQVATITTIGQVQDALAGRAGTQVHPD